MKERSRLSGWIYFLGLLLLVNCRIGYDEDLVDANRGSSGLSIKVPKRHLVHQVGKNRYAGLMHAKSGEISVKIGIRNNIELLIQEMKAFLSRRSLNSGKKAKLERTCKRAAFGDESAIAALLKIGLISQAEAEAIREGCKGNTEAKKELMNKYDNRTGMLGHAAAAAADHALEAAEMAGELSYGNLEKLKESEAHGNKDAHHKLHHIKKGYNEAKAAGKIAEAVDAEAKAGMTGDKDDALEASFKHAEAKAALEKLEKQNAHEGRFGGAGEGGGGLIHEESLLRGHVNAHNNARISMKHGGSGAHGEGAAALGFGHGQEDEGAAAAAALRHGHGYEGAAAAAAAAALAERHELNAKLRMNMEHQAAKEEEATKELGAALRAASDPMLLKAEAYLAEDREKRKAALAAEAKFNLKAKMQLDDIIYAENLAAAVIAGTPGASEKFSNFYSQIENNVYDDQRILKRVLETDENKVVESIQNQEGLDNAIKGVIVDEGSGAGVVKIIDPKPVEVVAAKVEVPVPVVVKEVVPHEEVKEAVKQAQKEMVHAEIKEAEAIAKKNEETKAAAEEAAKAKVAAEINAAAEIEEANKIKQEAENKIANLANISNVQIEVPDIKMPINVEPIPVNENEKRKALAAAHKAAAYENAIAAKQLEATTAEENAKRIAQEAEKAKIAEKLSRAHKYLESIRTEPVNNNMKLADLIKRIQADKEILNHNKALVAETEAIKNAIKEEAILKAQEAEKKSVGTISPVDEQVASEHAAAKQAEEKLANEAEMIEIAKARDLAYNNVKMLGGSDEEAAAEADKAEKVKRDSIELQKAKLAEMEKERLKIQMNDTAAAAISEHLAIAHNGRNPTGNTADEIMNKKNSVENLLQNEAIEEGKSKSEKLGIVKVIADSASEVKLHNSEVKLPLAEIPNIKAKNKEEEDVKLEQEELRDEIRNKVTKNKYNSGLVLIKSEEGYLNVSESAKYILIKKGKVYFTQQAFKAMEDAKINTSALKPMYAKDNKGPLDGEAFYYEADLIDMKLLLPTPGDLNPKKILSNGNDIIDISHASKIQIDEGILKMTPWEEFASKMRPKVYRGIDDNKEFIADDEKNKFEKREQEKFTYLSADANVFKNPNGEEALVEIRPFYGVPKTVGVQKAIEEMQNETSKKESEGINIKLNLDENPQTDSAMISFMKEAAEKAAGRGSLALMLDPHNPIDNSNNEVVEKVKNLGDHPKEENVKRPDVTNEDKVFNLVLKDSDEMAKRMKMSPKQFRELISKISSKTITEIILYYNFISSSPDTEKNILGIINQNFINDLKLIFTTEQIEELIKEIFDSIHTVTGVPNKLNSQVVFKIPILPIAGIRNRNVGTINGMNAETEDTYRNPNLNGPIVISKIKTDGRPEVVPGDIQTPTFLLENPKIGNPSMPVEYGNVNLGAGNPANNALSGQGFGRGNQNNGPNNMRGNQNPQLRPNESQPRGNPPRARGQPPQQSGQTSQQQKQKDKQKIKQQEPIRGRGRPDQQTSRSSSLPPPQQGRPDFRRSGSLEAGQDGLPKMHNHGPRGRTTANV